MKIKTEVLIIGGGATGVGISRDLGLRGIPSVLIEKGDFASGASGRNHGLLHSGARYAVTDPEAAKECIRENRILKKIAPHCIEETDGLFVSLLEDDLNFRDRFIKACEEAEIPYKFLSRQETLDLESELNPDLTSAIKVPDGGIDPFTLILDNAREAQTHGANILLHTECISMALNGKQIREVKVKDLIHGEEYSIEASFFVNATGAWTNKILNLAGIHIGMVLSKGSMIITNQRLNHHVINRCRPPSDGDIIVPNHTVSILGTTSIRQEEVENFKVTPPEVSLLIRETSKMIPAIQETRFIRAYAGVRPLIQLGKNEEDRALSRGFILIDHEERDAVKNLITITGGKLMTYRLMAEKTSDLICKKMGLNLPCSTHLIPLPGADQRVSLKERLQQSSTSKKETLCDCEFIQRNEIEEIFMKERMKDLQDILHRTRLAKGTCQGGFCFYRLLGVLHEWGRVESDSNQIIEELLEERWKGIHPILWGTALKEEELIESIYKGIFNLTPNLPSSIEGEG